MGYQFALASVLRVRGIAEEQEERSLQKILLEINQTREALADIISQIDHANQARTDQAAHALPGYHIHALYSEMVALKQAKADLESKLTKLDEMRKVQIQAYQSARRNREMLTDMRDAQQVEYDACNARSEQRTLDDNHIARRGRL